MEVEMDPRLANVCWDGEGEIGGWEERLGGLEASGSLGLEAGSVALSRGGVCILGGGGVS